MAKIIDRLLLFLFSLAIIVAACCMLAAAFNWIPLEETQDFVYDVYTDNDTAIAFITGCVLFLLIGIRFFYISVRMTGSQVPGFDQRNDLGLLTVSVETIENLALKAAGRTRGVKELRARVSAGNAGFVITIRSIVDGETPIPVLTEEIQNAVKQQLEQITGFPVESVSVYVANVVQSSPTFKSRVE